jgi:2-polyprenyl-6-methoxyphenol hydroxylase-like FAD-dependent oxidoreductase
MSDHYDVVICGGGLAGLTLGRQLRQSLPHLSIAIIDKTARPLPAAAHKVGESSVEIGAHYFSRVLDLEQYLAKAQLPKLGLRFFFGDSRGPLENRPELGARQFPPVPSYQLDRGVLENDLRRLGQESGITFYEGSTVESIELAQAGENHRIRCRPLNDTGPTLMRRAGAVLSSQC